MRKDKHLIAKFLSTIGGIVLLFVLGMPLLLWVAFEMLFPAPKICTADILNINSIRTSPQFSQSLELIGHFGGTVQSIFTTDSYAYAGIGTELAVLDISTPSHPQRVGYHILPDKAVDIYVDGNYAYAAVGDWGLRIIDISNPTNPFEVGSYSTSVPIQRIVVSKGYAYLPLSECESYGTFLPTRCSGGVQIIDVSNPSQPVRVGCHKMSGTPASIAIDGNFAYISEFTSSGISEARLLKMDISIPRFARIIKIQNLDFGGKLVANDGFLYFSARFDKFRILNISNPYAYFETGLYDSKHPSGTRNAIYDAVVSEQYAYLVVEGVGIQVLDISNQAQPILVSNYEVTGKISDISLSGNYIYIATDINGLEIVSIEDHFSLAKSGAYESPISVSKLEVIDNLLYTSSEDSGMRVVDVFDPKMPTIVAGYSFSEGMMNLAGDDEKIFVSGIEVDKNQAYLAIKDIGITTVDISNPSNPFGSDLYSIPYGINDIAIQDNRAYITKGANTSTGINGVEVIKLPLNSSIVENNYTLPSSFNEVVLGDNYAYILGDEGLLTIDISDPRDIRQVGFYNSKNQFGLLGLAIDNNNAYIATSNGLQIVSLSNSGIPSENQSSFFQGLRVVDIVTEDGLAYAATISGLRILNISNPKQPELVGSYRMKTQVTYAVIKDDNIVYLSTQDEGVIILDVSIPSNPIKLGNYVPSSEVESLAIEGNYVYIATRNDGLRVIDISNPATPTEMGFIENLEHVKDVTIKGKYAYITFKQGIAIIDIASSPKLSIVKQYVIEGKAEKIAVMGNYAYVSGRIDGLWLIDMNAIDSPGKIYHYGGSYYQTNGIDIQGEFAYIAAGHHGLQILNISNPLSLAEISIFEVDRVNLSDVAVFGNLVYVTNQESFGSDINNDLIAIDVSNPYKPVEIGSYNLPGAVRGVAVDDKYIYIAAGTDGVYIFRLTTLP